MNLPVVDLENKKVGELTVSEGIFDLPVRGDILARMIRYQLAKRRSGNHQAKGISLVRGTTRKPFRQKGTGRARAGSLRAPQMRGGGVVFGPVVRSHAIKLTKKVRRLALKIALSAKKAEGKLLIVDHLAIPGAKTKELAHQLGKFSFKSALFVDGNQVNDSFSKASENLHWIDVLPQQGINVYDVLRREWLILTQEAVGILEKRLSNV